MSTAANPWEKYQSQGQAPWEKYQAAPKATPTSTETPGVTATLAAPQLKPLLGFTSRNLASNVATGLKEYGKGIIGMGKEVLYPQGNTETERLKDIANKLVFQPADVEAQKARTAPTALESIGHSVASAIPVLGPWAASLGEQAGTSDVGGAVARGGIQMLAAKATPKILDTIKAAPNLVARGTVAMMGGGEDAAEAAQAAEAVKAAERQAAYGEKVKETTESNRQALSTARQGHEEKVDEIKGENKQAMSAARQAHEEKVGDIEAENQAKAQTHAQRVAKVQAENAESTAAVQAGEQAAAQAGQHAQAVSQALPEIYKSVRGAAKEMYPEIDESTNGREVTTGLQKAINENLVGGGAVPTSLARALKSFEHGGPISFDDIHGMYSELGEEMFGARDLPGDTYSTLKASRDFLGGKLQDMAKAAGKSNEFKAAQENWAKFENTWNNTDPVGKGGSPLAKALRARDPISGQLRPDYVRDALVNDKTFKVSKQLLERYPETRALATQLDQLKAAHDAAKAAPKTAKVKELPPAPVMKSMPTVAGMPTMKEMPTVVGLPGMKELPEAPASESFNKEAWRENQLRNQAFNWQKIGRPYNLAPWRLPYTIPQMILGHIMANPTIRKTVVSAAAK